MMRHLLFSVGLACAWAVGCGGDSEFSGGSGGSAGKGGSGEAGEPSDSSGATGGSAAGGKGGSSGKGGGSSGSAGSGATGGVPLADAPAAYAEAYCALLERCAGILYDLTLAYEDCATLTGERLRQGGFDALETAVEAGKVAYHPELLPACLDAIETRDCTLLNERDIDACNRAIAGTAAEGESCGLTEECEGSLICETKDACPGTCVERYGAGIPCAVDDECADGLVCSNVTAHCVAPPEEGDACGGGVEPQCAAGLLCGGDDQQTKRTGLCAKLEAIALHAEGEACDPGGGAVCERGLSCVVTAYEDDALKWECQERAPLNAPCGVGVPEACQLGQYCSLTSAEVAAGTFVGQCKPLPAAGEACVERPLGFLPSCAPFARCQDNGICIGLRDLGESCTTDALCYSGHCIGGACEPGHACE